MSADDDLAAFLTARYGEAEALATRARDDAPDWYASRELDERRSLRDRAGDRIPETAAAYVADNDPAHRLADIALKRAILAEHASFPDGDGNPRCNRCMAGRLDENFSSRSPCTTVRQLGTEFSNHPDYKPGWAPEDSRG